jgi:hypothetical protein
VNNVPLASIERLLVSDAQLAEITGVAVGTWRKWRTLGYGPRYYRIGVGSRRLVKYNVTEVWAWLGTKGSVTQSDAGGVCA